MTAGALIQKAWEELGEPSDLSPATVGVPKLLEAVNDAQDVVAQWIDNRGRKCYFREMEGSFQFPSVVLTGTFDIEASGTSVTLPGTVVASLGRFVRWVLTVGSESRDVLASVVTGGRNVLTVSEAFSVPLLAATFSLGKREYHFTGLDALDTDGVRVVEVNRIFDIATGSQLTIAPSAEHLTTIASGTPSVWRHRNSGIVFDVAPTAERYYLAHVMRLPNKVNEQTDELDLPDAFMQAILLRIVWWGYRRMQDFQAAYSTKKDFEELMTRLATASWLSNEPDYFTVRDR